MFTFISIFSSILLQISKMELSAKIVNDWIPLTIFAKSFILDICYRKPESIHIKGSTGIKWQWKKWKYKILPTLINSLFSSKHLQKD